MPTEDKKPAAAAAPKAASKDQFDGAGATRTTDEVIAEQRGNNAAPSAVNDVTGKISNRVEGTIQREPTPEELPADAKIAPVLEQVAPNQMSQAVGALPQPEELNGVEQPKEGRKNVEADMSDAEAFLSETSDQQDEAKIAVEDAARDADRGRV